MKMWIKNKISNCILNLKTDFLRRLTVIILACVFLGCTIWLICFKISLIRHCDMMNQIKKETKQTCLEILKNQSNSGEVSSFDDELASFTYSNLRDIEEINIPELSELKEKNSDTIGWISIPNTNIQYPVMFTPQNPEFYLHRNFYKKYEYRGNPFLDGRTDLLHSFNYLIYGHSMKDGTEFADLLKYENKRYWQEHSVIFWEDIYGKKKYKIIAAFRSQVYPKNSNKFKYYKVIGENDEEAYKEYVHEIKKMSIYDTGETAVFGEHLLTLSTCSYHVDNGRFAVVAKEIYSKD